MNHLNSTKIIRDQLKPFYEKLLLLKDLINTETAKKNAEDKHKFMKQFLDQFFKEWEKIDDTGYYDKRSEFG